MDWTWLSVGYLLISFAFVKGNDYWALIFNTAVLTTGATIVTVQILTHLGVS